MTTATAQTDLDRLEQVIREKYPDELARSDSGRGPTAAHVATRLLERRQEENRTPFGEDYTEQIKVGVIGVLSGGLLVGAIAAGLWLANSRNQAAAAPPADVEYYRGVYDICMYMAAEENQCLAFSSAAAEKDWYGQASPGWEWPVPQITAEEPQ